MYVDDRNVRTTSVSSFSEQINILIQDFTHRLPKSKLIFISIKPSLPYLNYYHKQAEFNAFLRGVSFSCKNIEYIDLWNPLLLKQGVMNLSLYKEDQQTLNEQGISFTYRKGRPSYEQKMNKLKIAVLILSALLCIRCEKTRSRGNHSFSPGVRPYRDGLH